MQVGWELKCSQWEGDVMKPLLVMLLVLFLSTSAFSVEHLQKRAYHMKQDFGSESLYDGALQYYYYIPCPIESWFWAFHGWIPGDILGACFRIGDVSSGGWPESGCEMHDMSCMPGLYPRANCGGAEPAVHSGYVGTSPFESWPPTGFVDGRDTTPDQSELGFIEWAMTIYIGCSGPSSLEASTWGSIKAIYR
jgi:hypothetical protein